LDILKHVFSDVLWHECKFSNRIRFEIEIPRYPQVAIIEVHVSASLYYWSTRVSLYLADSLMWAGWCLVRAATEVFTCISHSVQNHQHHQPPAPARLFLIRNCVVIDGAPTTVVLSGSQTSSAESRKLSLR